MQPRASEHSRMRVLSSGPLEWNLDSTHLRRHAERRSEVRLTLRLALRLALHGAGKTERG